MTYEQVEEEEEEATRVAPTACASRWPVIPLPTANEKAKMRDAARLGDLHTVVQAISLLW